MSHTKVNQGPHWTRTDAEIYKHTCPACQAPVGHHCVTDAGKIASAHIGRVRSMPPTSGFHKLGSAAQAAARSRAKAFYPFD